MEPQVFSNQLTFSSTFHIQVAPTVPTQQVASKPNVHIDDSVITEIEDKRDRILELQREMGADGEALLNAEEDEIDMEPDEGDEDIFDAVAPMLEEDLANTRYQNEADIRTLKKEIKELERGL